jgi:hypothetical protein
MKYTIKTDDAAKLKEIILSCVEKKKDIITWDVKVTDKEEKVLIHVTDQWEDKGNLHLTASKDNKELKVTSKYWTKFKKEDRSGDEDKYLFGRFTELLLVHFWKSGMIVEIS